MSTRLVVFGLLEIALWGSAASKAFHLRRSPDDLPLRAVTVCVVCTALGPFLSLPPVDSALEGTATGLPKLLVNLITLTATYWLLAFFRYSVHGAAARRSMRLHLIPLLAAHGVLIITWALSPAEVRSAPAALANGHDPHATVFVLTAIGYMAYGLALALHWSAAYARITTRAHLRNGLRIIAVALAALLGACGIKIALALVQVAVSGDWTAMRVLNGAYVALVLLGSLLLAAGVSYPAVADVLTGLPVLLRRRSVYRELGPLWHALRDAFPQLVLADRSPVWRKGAVPWLPWTHRAYYRRVIEIRDGIVQLSPYYDTPTAERARAGGRAAGLEGGDLETYTHAALTVDALRRKAAERPAEHPYPTPVGGAGDLDSDALWLVRLSRAVAEG